MPQCKPAMSSHAVPSMRLLYKSSLDKAYNDKNKFYKQSYNYMYASYMYTYTMGVLVSACVVLHFSYTCVNFYMRARKISTHVFVSAVTCVPRTWSSCYTLGTHVDRLSCGDLYCILPI